MSFHSERINITKEIWPYVKKFGSEWLALFVLKIGQIIPHLLYPLIFKLFLDEVIEKYNINLLYTVILFYLGLYVLETILKVLHRYVDNHLFNKVALNLRTIIWERYSYMPISKFREYNISDLRTRVDRDVDILKYFIIWEIFDYSAYIASFIFSAILLWSLDWRIALLSYVLIPLSIIISNGFQKKVNELYETERKIRNRVEQWMHISLSNWKEIKANNLVDWHNKRLDVHLDEQFDNFEETTTHLLKRNTLLNIKDSLVNQLIILIAGGILHFMNSIAVSTVIVSIQFYNRMVTNFSNILQMNIELERLKPTVNRVIEIVSMDDAYKIEENDKITMLDTKEKDVFILEHLNYVYSGSTQKALDDIKMTVKAKDKVAIFGKSGAGKSTLRRLLTGDLAPEEGAVKFYGLDIATLKHQLLYKKMDVISQESYFMNLTIEEYLKMAKNNASLSEIESACEKTNILSYIKELPDGFDTRIGERGDRLSGGQKQRLSLARLFLSDSEVIVIDEAFSAIDGKDKTNILDHMFTKFNDKTIICVSHDEDVMKYFPTKICIEDGKEFVYE